MDSIFVVTLLLVSLLIGLVGGRATLAVLFNWMLRQQSSLRTVSNIPVV
jgi:hypothetical protein